MYFPNGNLKYSTSVKNQIVENPKFIYKPKCQFANNGRYQNVKIFLPISLLNPPHTRKTTRSLHEEAQKRKASHKQAYGNKILQKFSKKVV